ncbi:MAG TPA: type II secretion system F family protein [Anaerolineaceae bacterium]|jgi:tight adherence protein B
MSLTLLLYIGGALGVLLLGVGLVISLTGEQAMVEERLGRYVDEEAMAVQNARSEPAARPMTDWLNKRVEGSSWGDNIARELARADIKLRSGEYIGVMIVAAAGVGIVVWFLAGRSIIVGILGAIVGLFLPRLYVKREQGRRLIHFNEQLADMLNLMVNGLRAGYSTMQAMEAVSKELPAPISDEFRRVVQEMQLGVPMERSLDNLVRRIPSDDLDLVITAINVQREVGGNLAEILDTISYTIRERVRIKGEIRVLTSQVMYSGRMLSLLPLAVFAIIYLLNRDYMMTFFKPESGICGYVALGVGLIMIASGYFVMNKLADIEV